MDTSQPFLGQEAVACGELTEWELRTHYRSVYRMGWPDWKVGVEYDGEQHWSDARQRAWDIERLVIA